MENTLQRIKKFIDFEGISVRRFEEMIGMSNGSFASQLKNNKTIGVDKLENILFVYPKINTEWLLTGEGEMLKNNESESLQVNYSISEFQQKGYAPYYSDLPMAAGQYDLNTIAQNEKPESWIKMPGITVEAWFPVIGYSMEPKIHAGDTVGVIQMHNWERIDPDKTYLIITHDDRMIKHLESDKTKPDILWAVSDNYGRFKIPKEDIVNIYRVVWAAKLV